MCCGICGKSTYDQLLPNYIHRLKQQTALNLQSIYAAQTSHTHWLTVKHN